jgi:hypothetical protein
MNANDDEEDWSFAQKPAGTGGPRVERVALLPVPFRHLIPVSVPSMVFGCYVRLCMCVCVRA